MNNWPILQRILIGQGFRHERTKSAVKANLIVHQHIEFTGITLFVPLCHWIGIKPRTDPVPKRGHLKSPRFFKHVRVYFKRVRVFFKQARVFFKQARVFFKQSKMFKKTRTFFENADRYKKKADMFKINADMFKINADMFKITRTCLK